MKQRAYLKEVHPEYVTRSRESMLSRRRHGQRHVQKARRDLKCAELPQTHRKKKKEKKNLGMPEHHDSSTQKREGETRRAAADTHKKKEKKKKRTCVCLSMMIPPHKSAKAIRVPTDVISAKRP